MKTDSPQKTQKAQKSAKWLLCLLCFLMVVAWFSACSAPVSNEALAVPTSTESKVPDVSDERLLQVATEALGQREGAVIVIDPQTGRLRVVVNSRLAFEQAYPPGSAIKPFTALAALRAGVWELQAQRQCQTTYSRAEFAIVCSHPRSKSPFNLSQALAYSCNDYFAHVGERLSEATFNAALSGFGYGQRTGIAAAEAAGSLPRGEWRVQSALGDDDRFLVTPIQLMMAYTALVNGGHLYRPRQTSDVASDAMGSAKETARISISPAHRTALIEGMRGAVKYGTAGKSGLGDLPGFVFGKTGTSTASNGFRTQGWFVAFAADKPPTGVPAPEQIKLGVLVFLKRAHGSQGADVAKAIFEATRYGTGSGSDRVGFVVSVNNPVATALGSVPVKVRSVSENITREMPLEDYLVGVLASEASIETEPEALKAQAVISRTFALRNPGRHAREGFDFCSTTHCQRFIMVKARQHEAARRAVAATRGEALRDRKGDVIDAYFHAACGGVTANIETLWGVEAPEYLRGVRDDFCSSMPHRKWEQTISANDLAKALRSDPKTDVGSPLKGLTVSKRDATGRAETITLTGAERRAVRGWDFKLIVGRALGWQMVKSSRFEVERRGDAFVFRGSGFGHGLGLCQEGAHVMAHRKMGYRQILSFYFPGTRLLGVSSLERVSGLSVEEGLGGGTVSCATMNDWQWIKANAPAYETAKKEAFRVTAGEGNNPQEVERALKILEAARKDLLRRLKTASLQLDERAPFEIVIHSTTAEFIKTTGLSGMVAGATRGRRIELQPLAVLNNRKVLATTLRHELTHSVIEVMGNGRAPRWLAEGLCLHVAGEAAPMKRVQIKQALSRNEIERRLKAGASAEEMRQLYAMAFHEVQLLIGEKGEAAVWRLVVKSKETMKV